MEEPDVEGPVVSEELGPPEDVGPFVVEEVLETGTPHSSKLCPFATVSMLTVQGQGKCRDLHPRSTTPSRQTLARHSSTPSRKHLSIMLARAIFGAQAQPTSRPILAARLAQVDFVVAEQRESRRCLAGQPIRPASVLASRARAARSKLWVVPWRRRLAAIKTAGFQNRPGRVPLVELVFLRRPEGQQLE